MQSIQNVLYPFFFFMICADHRFSSSGREDVDVRMLGDGRPFIVELINPHCVIFSKQDMAVLQQVSKMCLALNANVMIAQGTHLKILLFVADPVVCSYAFLLNLQ